MKELDKLNFFSSLKNIPYAIEYTSYSLYTNEKIEVVAASLHFYIVYKDVRLEINSHLSNYVKPKRKIKLYKSLHKTLIKNEAIMTVANVSVSYNGNAFISYGQEQVQVLYKLGLIN